MLIAQYDETGNGRLCFSEFNQFALPATNETLRHIATSRDYSLYKSNSCVLVPSLEGALARLFASEIDYQRRTEGLKIDLNARFDFSVRLAFDELDRMAPPNRIDRCEIRQFVDAYLRWLVEPELDAIIRRCDTDCDEALSYLEFSEVVSGIKPVTVTHVTHSPAVLRSSPVRHTHSPFRTPIVGMC